MSFFKKFTPAGSTPIAVQKPVVRTFESRKPSSSTTKSPSSSSSSSTSSASGTAKAAVGAGAGTPRRAASSNVLISNHSRVNTPSTPTSSTATPDITSPRKRKLDSARSTPQLKRPSPSSLFSSAPRHGGLESRHSKHPSPSDSSHRHGASAANGYSRCARAASVASSSHRSPRHQRLESSDEESEEDDRGSKRSKHGSTPPRVAMKDGSGRKMVHPISFHKRNPKTGEPVSECKFVHADQIASVNLKGWSRRPEFRNSDIQLMHVGLHYPGIGSQEKFQLVSHSDPDEFDPIAEILTTMEKLSDHLCPPDISDQIHSETCGGIVYRMRRALKHGDTQKFLDNLKTYNSIVRQCRKDGTFKRRIAGMLQIPFPLVEHILQQSYARTVALEVEGLKDYQAFSNEVYGELLPKFTSKIFRETKLGPDKVFIDLGSGTGNVVLHAALETGCESWGCEKMSKPALLAFRQRDEFLARCRMWGVSHGPVHLEHDTFLENRNIAEAMKRADVLLVNNFAFEPDLNQKLLDMFLDLKEGAIIVSLKPFVPKDHVITERNKESPVGRLRMVEREYFSREVSWTDSAGKYYIQTVDGSMLREYEERERKEKERAKRSEK